MFLSQSSIVFICFAFLTLQQLATGLVCYNCFACSTVDGNTATTIVPDGAGYSCFKSITTALSITTVTRGAETNCVEGSGTVVGVSGSYHCCTSDRCNAGITLSSSFGLAFLMVAISVVVRATIIG